MKNVIPAEAGNLPFVIPAEARNLPFVIPAEAGIQGYLDKNLSYF